MNKILGVITARGGSKGVPGKNIKEFAGLPLIEWTIKAALNSDLLDEVVVSTDSPDIADVARSCGAEVPTLRNPEYAKDNSPHIDAVLEAISWRSKLYTHCCLLQPTSPLRTTIDIDCACIVALHQKRNSVVSVNEDHRYKFVAKPTWSKALLCPPGISGYAPRQSIPPRYFINGAVYVNTIKHLIKKRSFYDTFMGYYVMPEERSMQIDTQMDFDIAEYMMLRRLDEVIYKTESRGSASGYRIDISL